MVLPLRYGLCVILFNTVLLHYRISLLLTLVLGFASDSCNNNNILLVVGFNYNIHTHIYCLYRIVNSFIIKTIVCHTAISIRCGHEPLSTTYCNKYPISTALAQWVLVYLID